MGVNKIFRFNEGNRVTEIEAASVSEARRRFNRRHGHFPGPEVDAEVVENDVV